MRFALSQDLFVSEIHNFENGIHGILTTSDLLSRYRRSHLREFHQRWVHR